MHKSYFSRTYVIKWIACIMLCASSLTIIHTQSHSTDESNYIDTVTACNSLELIQQLRSNRIIRLIDIDYILSEPLTIDSLHYLKIIGSEKSILKRVHGNAGTVSIKNSQYITLDHLIIGSKENAERSDNVGALYITLSKNIVVLNSEVIGRATTGLVTETVREFSFFDSEITHCSDLIFEIRNSNEILFLRSQFHNNELSISVLGGFTNGTKNVTFDFCVFSNNTPKLQGNPAFNFMDNYDNLDKVIFMTQCVFKNNRGFKWYNDKIQLEKCQTDSSGIIGLN